MKPHHYLALGLSVAVTTSAFSHGTATNSTNANNVTIATQGNYRYITSDGMPATHGAFPNSGNPNTISSQSYHFRMPLNPVKNSKPTMLARNMDFGVALDGVPLDPFTAEYWDNGKRGHQVSAWNYAAMPNASMVGLDFNNAHVQPNGAYHYHGVPENLYKQLSGGKTPPNQMVLVGYAADGFPVYGLYGYKDATSLTSDLKLLTSSYKIKSGTRPANGPSGNYDGTYIEDYEYVAGSGDLDQCNGRTGVTPEYPAGTYYYVLTNSYPYIPRCYYGTPDSTFITKMGHGGISGDPRGAPPQGRMSPPPGDRTGPPPRNNINYGN